MAYSDKFVAPELANCNLEELLDARQVCIALGFDSAIDNIDYLILHRMDLKDLPTFLRVVSSYVSTGDQASITEPLSKFVAVVGVCWMRLTTPKQRKEDKGEFGQVLAMFTELVEKWNAQAQAQANAQANKQ